MKAPKPILARILEYKGKIICWPQQTGKDKGWVPTGDHDGNNLGCVILDSRRMEMSKKAIEVMDGIPRNGDCIGDMDWWACTGGTKAFSWFAAMFRIVDPRKCQLARDTKMFPDDCVIIPNRLPLAIRREIDAAMKDPKLSKFSMWRTPYSLVCDKPWELPKRPN